MLWFIAIGGLLVGYVLGVKVGHSAGIDVGRRRADREWAQWAEHGAAPVPEIRRGAA